jgi:dTDP-4-dehydrorhamnose 3,5-epimerase-like enzyme
MDQIKLVKLIDLPKIRDIRGNLSFIEQGKHIPFKIARAYWIYDVPGGEVRGGHAFKTQDEFIIALSGSFSVVLDDGKGENIYQLCRSYYGLYVPKMVWRSLENFSTNSVCLILSSENYSEEDYIRNFRAFKQINNAY